MKFLPHIFSFLFLFSCNEVKNNSNEFLRNSSSKNITFIIDLKVNENSTEDLNQFINEITENVLKSESFCLEYAYYISEDKKSITLYEKYDESSSGVKHGQNFINGPYFERFFNLFTLEKFIVTGPATKEFKDFALENGFVIDYRENVDGFIR